MRICGRTHAPLDVGAAGFQLAFPRLLDHFTLRFAVGGPSPTATSRAPAFAVR